MLHTGIGQYLDCASDYTKEKNNLDKFTMELFDTIAHQKTGIYSFKFPMLLALTLVKDGKNRYSEEANKIAWDLGRLWQFQVINILYTVEMDQNCPKSYKQRAYEHFRLQ